MKYARTILAAVIGAATLVEFLFWGGAGIGFTLLFLILLLAFYIACGFPKAGLIHTAEHIILLTSAVALAMCYTFFDNEALRLLNFPALGFLLGLIFLHGTVGKNVRWDKPMFQAELWIGYFVRPFACIARPWKELWDLRSNKKADENPARSSAMRKTGLQVILTFLAAIPLLVILVTLLASSDPVFRDVFKPFITWLENLHFDEVIGKIFLFVFFVPFTASAVWSYRDSFTVNTFSDSKNTTAPLRIPQASAITLLAMVNAVYLLYAGVQFAYLFGAWGGSLPDGLTYAEYARNGFFELAFISCINILLLLCSIRLTKREGKPGIVIRCLSTCLLILSSVQLVSAMQRMRLYIAEFGLSQLRFFVSAFMLLIAVYFVFLLIREFVSSFPLFRFMVFAGAAALIILNYSVPDARIAQYNIEHYQSGDLESLDTDYIFYNLSADAKIILYKEEAALTKDNENMKSAFVEIDSYRAPLEDNYRSDNWKMYNVSRERLQQYLLKNS